MELITLSRRNRSSDFSSSFNYMAKKKKKKLWTFDQHFYTEHEKIFERYVTLYT